MSLELLAAQPPPTDPTGWEPVLCSKCGAPRRCISEAAMPRMYQPCPVCYPERTEKLASEDAQRRAVAPASATFRRIVAANPVDVLYARYALRGASLASTVENEHTRFGLNLCRGAVSAFLANPTGVGVEGFGLVGPKGTGKTWLAVALVRDLRAAEIPAMLFTVSDLLAAIQATWGDERAEASFRNLLASCPLLVLDDLGKEPYKKNSWSLSTLFDVVNARWNRDLPIVVTANARAEDTLRSKYAGDDVFDAIVDRLEGIFSLTWAEVDGESLRLTPPSV
jgi:DNA replication protein DnaC